MGRVNAILLALVMLCAIGVITSQHRARKVFVELEAEQEAAKRLDEEYTQLRLEQSTWATNKRVESLASKNLGMRLPEPDTTVVVTLDSRAQPGAAR
ncbi:MAG TPA: cell division protein FtsL [Usitatibacter sp.]|nr:cell division protein FtsL [Usitatibacter sp.]